MQGFDLGQFLGPYGLTVFLLVLTFAGWKVIRYFFRRYDDGVQNQIKAIAEDLKETKKQLAGCEKKHEEFGQKYDGLNRAYGELQGRVNEMVRQRETEKGLATEIVTRIAEIIANRKGESDDDNMAISSR